MFLLTLLYFTLRKNIKLPLWLTCESCDDEKNTEVNSHVAERAESVKQPSNMQHQCMTNFLLPVFLKMQQQLLKSMCLLLFRQIH